MSVGGKLWVNHMNHAHHCWLHATPLSFTSATVCTPTCVEHTCLCVCLHVYFRVESGIIHSTKRDGLKIQDSNRLRPRINKVMSSFESLKNKVAKQKQAHPNNKYTVLWTKSLFLPMLYCVGLIICLLNIVHIIIIIKIDQCLWVKLNITQLQHVS